MTDNTKLTLARYVKDILFLICIGGLIFTVVTMYAQNMALRNANFSLSTLIQNVQRGGTLAPPPPPKPVEKPEPDTGYILPGFNIPEDVVRRLISYTSDKHCPTHGVVCDWRYA